MAALLWDCQTLVCLYKKRGVYLQMRAGNIAAILMRAPSPAARVCNCFLGPPSSILHQLSAAWLCAGTALMIINTSTVDKSDKNCWQNYWMKMKGLKGFLTISCRIPGWRTTLGHSSSKFLHHSSSFMTSKDAKVTIFHIIIWSETNF